jgi:predicted nuclease of predicted toxin-antitoxin system
MKLLIDQNISHRIIPVISELFSELTHVRNVGLKDKSDYEIFMFARQNNFNAVISLDEDFVHILQTFNSPPKIIWLKTGNCSTTQLAQLLIQKNEIILEFINSEEKDCLEIYKF